MRKTILITGTSTGLGRMTALHFAKMGWNVAATMRSPEKDTVLSRVENIGVFKMDVTKPETIQTAIQDAVGRFGGIDVIVNNAGIGLYGALELTAEADLDKAYQVNIRGVMNVIRGILPHFRKMGSGIIINISSVMGRSTALPLGSLYNMSKFGLEGLTEGLYFELKPFNIDLYLVEPGGFESAFGENVLFSESDIIQDYQRITENVRKIMTSARQRPGISPQPIVDSIYSIAIGKRTAFRTVVGKDAKMVLLLRRLLPIKVFLGFLHSRVSK